MSSTVPNWVASGSEEDKKLYGAAKGFGADADVLSDRNICLGFVESKKQEKNNQLTLTQQPQARKFFP
jgi:hypothetical protein